MSTIALAGQHRSAAVSSRSAVAPVAKAARVAPVARVASGAAASARTPAGAPMRLTRRGRVVLVILALALVVALGSIAGRALAARPIVEPAYQVIVVAPGQTLWGIASEIAGPDEDVRDVVAQLASLNELDSVALIAGEELRVPVVEAS